MNTSEGGGTHWFEMISFIYDTDFRPTLLFRSNFPKLKDIFDTNHLPIIVAWASDRNDLNKYNDHFSVVKKDDENNVTLADPAYGDHYKMSAYDFTERWYGAGAQGGLMFIEP